MRVPTTLSNWAGATAFVVAMFLSAGWAIAMVASALDDQVSEAGVQLLTGLGVFWQAPSPDTWAPAPP